MFDETINYYLLFIYIFSLIFFYTFYRKNKYLFQEKSNEILILQKELTRYTQNYNNVVTENTQFFQKLSNLNSLLNEIKLIASSKDKEIQTLKTTLEKQEIQFKLSLTDSIKAAREDAIKKSRSVLRGQASEHLAPYVIKDTNPKDYRFMGNPIDYICFDGLSDVLDKKADQITSVRFVDIKTGKSNLNKSQRRIRDAIKDGRVSFEVVNLDEVINDKSTNQ
jgi:predicted Holliday junction resolvase-like endonuclease